MPTVGLSFGSPTSGTGFDVSATVSRIVGNLRNVETPWKTQLTQLQSQDTAISSLGTLFSSLSNDLSALTDFKGIMAQKLGSSSDTNVLTLTAATSSAIAGTHSVAVSKIALTSSGYLNKVTSSSSKLQGSITLQVGTGATQTITLDSTNNTLSGLAKAINASGVGVTASVLTDPKGSRLSLVSGTPGALGNISISDNSIRPILNYTAATGTINPGGTFEAIAQAADTLSGSMTIKVGGGALQTINVPTNDNTLQGLADAINNTADIGVTASVVTDPGGSRLSLLSNTADALTVTSNIVDTSSSLAYNKTVTGSDAELTVDGVDLTSSSNTVANLIPGVTFQLLAPSAKLSDGSLEQIQVMIANDNSGVESAVAGMVSDYNALMSAIGAQSGLDSSNNPEPLFGSPTLSLVQQQLLAGLNTQNPNGELDSISNDTNTTLSGSISIQVGSSAAQLVTLDSSHNTLGGLASAINAANIGVTATVVTTGNRSSLSLLSHTTGSSGGLTVSSNIAATSETLLSYSGKAGSLTQRSTGTLAGVLSANHGLEGSIAIQVGSGAAQTVNVDPAHNTLSGLASSINAAGLGVTASVVTNQDGSSSLSLLSQTDGGAGTLSVTSNILDTSNTTTTTLNYNHSSDLSGLANLGITVSANADGSLTFDAATLDSVLNGDFSGAVGFFQNANSWGRTFAAMLNNAGSTSTSGSLSLARKAISSSESTLNADISKEESLISAQEKNLTTQLNKANQILQQLPSQLDGINQIYSAISGYKTSN